MDMTVFAQKLCRALEQSLGDGHQVKLQTVEKNNGVLLESVMIQKEGSNICPSIYLKPFWEAYEKGRPFAELVQSILEVYRRETPKNSIDLSFFGDFDRVKERICFRLIHRERNKTLLERIPYLPFLDLAVCFFYAYEGEQIGKGSILIRNEHMEKWETDLPELMHLAERNTQELFPWECSPLSRVLEDLLKDSRSDLREYSAEELQKAAGELPVHVFSNRQRIYGAACILYPGVLEMLSEKFQHSFYLIPSSVHEVLLLPDKGWENPEHLREIIAEVNRTQVDPEEFLSDSLYRFDPWEKRVMIL